MKGVPFYCHCDICAEPAPPPVCTYCESCHGTGVYKFCPCPDPDCCGGCESVTCPECEGKKCECLECQE